VSLARRRLYLVANDTPTLLFDLVDGKTGEPIDLSNAATVARLKVRLATAAANKATITAGKLTGRSLPNGQVDPAPPYDVAGAGGRCAAACDATVFDAAGEYLAELEVTFGASSQVATPYQLLDIVVRADF
jgi:hypothetical protein